MIAAWRQRLEANWFFVALPPLLLIEWLVARNLGGEMGTLLEAVVLFDLCLFMPALYVLCYRHTVSLKHLMLRAAGLVCLGVYIATYLVPPPVQQMLPHLSWLRIFGLAVLALIELRVLIMVVRMIYANDLSQAQVQAASGAPAWIARLMLMEARFWKAVWRILRR